MENIKLFVVIRQATGWTKIFARYITKKELVFRIYKAPTT